MDNLIPYTSRLSKLNLIRDSIAELCTTPDQRLNPNWLEYRWIYQNSFHLDDASRTLVFMKIEGIVFFDKRGIQGFVIESGTDPKGCPIPEVYVKAHEEVSKQMKRWMKEYKPCDYLKYRKTAYERNLQKEFVRFI